MPTMFALYGDSYWGKFSSRGAEKMFYKDQEFAMKEAAKQREAAEIQLAENLPSIFNTAAEQFHTPALAEPDAVCNSSACQFMSFKLF